MNTKEIMQKLRETFSSLIKEEVKFMDATLQDGTMIQVTELAIGGIVSANGAPVPPGEYMLNDGTKLVVGDNGAITEIEMPEAAPVESLSSEPMAQSADNGFAAFESTTNEKFSQVESKFAAYEQKISALEVKLEKTHNLLNELMNFTQRIAELPTGTPDESVKTQNNFKIEKPKYNFDLLFNK